MNNKRPIRPSTPDMPEIRRPGKLPGMQEHGLTKAPTASDALNLIQGKPVQQPPPSASPKSRGKT